jgi:hypothetical protein
MMENIKYIYPEYGREYKGAGVCPGCRVPPMVSCPVCGNQVVGEQIQAEG